MLPLCYARLVREPGQGSLPMCVASLKSSGSQVGRAAITGLLKKASVWWPHHLTGLKGLLRQQGPFLYAMRVGLSDRQDNPQRHVTYYPPRNCPLKRASDGTASSTILTHKRASRITASHLNGKSHAGPRHLCRKAPRALFLALTIRGQCRWTVAIFDCSYPDNTTPFKFKVSELSTQSAKSSIASCNFSGETNLKQNTSMAISSNFRFL